MSQVSVIAIVTQLLPWSKKFPNKIIKLIFVIFAIHEIKSNKWNLYHNFFALWYGLL